MPTPRIEKDVRTFLGRIQYISHFIAQLTPVCKPLFKLLRKNISTQWNNDYQIAFDKIKNYLLSPPVLISTKPDHPLILYMTIHDCSMGCVLGQHDKTGKKEQVIYYLSKRFIDYKTKYTPLEKTYLSLVYVTKRLRHYFLSYKVFLISWINPIKYLFKKPVTIGRNFLASMSPFMSGHTLLHGYLQWQWRNQLHLHILGGHDAGTSWTRSHHVK